MSSIYNFGKEPMLNHREELSKIDTFGRLRVSNPVTLFDFHHVNNYQENSSFSEIIYNGSTFTYSNDSYVQLSVTSTIGSKVVSQTKQYVPYQPGKSKLVFMTGILETSGGTTGIRSRIGTFDDENDKNTSLYDSGGNGLFFELDGNDLYVVERRSSNGTGQTDYRVKQSEWNIDTFGAGSLNPSKKIINDFSKCLLFVFDMEWLGVGFSRFGFVLDGKIHYCHIFKHKKLIKPYIRYAKLPLRYEIENVSSSSEGKLRKICGTVLSEGGYNIRGRVFSDGTNANSITVPSSKYIPVISLKLKNEFNRNTLYLKKIDFLISATTNKPIHYDVRFNPSVLEGVSFRDINTMSIAEISVTGTTIVGGKTINSGYIKNKESGSFFEGLDDLLSNLQINSNITGESDILSVAAIGIGGDAELYIQANWLEIN